MEQAERKKFGGIRKLSCHHYSPNKRKTNIMFLDATNLYGWAQSCSLPYDSIHYIEGNEFEEMTRELIVNHGKNLVDDGENGWVFEVTLSYPEHLHKTHAQYPILPKSHKIKDDELSTYHKSILNIKKRVKAKKLVADLHKKEKYTVHYRLLKKALVLALILEEVHSVIKF